MATQQIGTATTPRTNFDVVLKEFYEGPVREHLNNSIPILKYVEKSKRSWNGRRVVFPIHLRRNHGVGARGETGTLPTAGKQEYVESKISSKFMYGRIELTGVVIAASQGDKGSFASALRTEVEGLRRDLKVDFNRQCWGNSDASSTETGVLALVNGTPTEAGGTTTFTVNNPGTRYIKKGMQLAVGTSDELNTNANAGCQYVTVASVPSTTTFTATGDFTAAVNADLIVQGESSGNSKDAEITGLSFLVSEADDDLQTVDTGDNPEWKANVLDNPAGAGTNRPLSLELMQLAIDNTDEVAGTEPNLIMGHHSLRREYINLLTSDVRYSPEQLKGGFQKLSYAGGMNPMPIEFDRMAPYNRLFFLQTKDIKLYTMKDWQWADRDGSSFSRKADSDSWEAFMCWYGNLGIERRFSQTLLADIEVDNLIF